MGDFLDKAGLEKVKAKIDAALATKLNASLKGAANGVAELDANGNVPSSQLPSYVDDVVEYLGIENFPATGEIDKIYLDTITDKTYRWSGSRYVQVSESLALGETSGTAYRGDRGKAAYDHALASGAQYSTGLYKIRTNAEGHVEYASAVTKSDITDLGVPGEQRSDSSIVNLIYPVGSIYLSVNETSPATLFGGTWEQLQDRFLIGAGNDYSLNGIGGATSQSYTPAGSVGSHTLTTSEIPSHNHTFTGSAVNTGNQSQDHTHTGTSGNQSAGHTHTGTSGNPSANHTHTGPSHTHTGPSHTHTGPSHSHGPAKGNSFYAGGTTGYKMPGGTGTWDLGLPSTTAAAGTGATGSAGTGATGSAGTGATGTVSAWHTHTTKTGGISANHTHTTTTGGVSKNHTHSVTAAGSIGNTGGGGGHNHSFTGTAATISTMPPYLAVYMWKRTA